MTPSLFPALPAPGAVISPCGRYRYTLTRPLAGVGAGTVNFVMLNPSTADAQQDDPTIRRCLGYARAWGYAGLVVTNLFALRATDPRDLRRAPDPVGPENDRHLLEQARRAALVVCAWGGHGTLHGRSAAVRRLLAGLPLHVLRLSPKTGAPAHPLYLPADLRPVPLEDAP